MISACGLTCTECPIYNAATDPEAAEELARQWQADGYENACADWFKCRGCHGPDDVVWGDDCKIRQCCIKEKKLENCSQCSTFPCGLITGFENDGMAHHKAAIACLREMRK